ncbi:unnamed protein product [Closterium sp. NIES-54]
MSRLKSLPAASPACLPAGVTVFTAYGASATSLIATLPDGGSSAASAASAKPLLYKGKTFIKYVAKMKPTKRNGKIVGDKGASGIASQAQSQAPGTPGQPAPQTSQHGSVGKPASAANDGVVRNDEDDDHSSTHPEETNAAKSQPRVTISVPAGESTLPSPVALKPQRPPCFDSSQRGGPTVQAWLFTLNVFFDANYVSEDTAKIRYAVSLLRGPAMDWWRVIVTKPVDYATLSTREGQTGPWAPSYFMEVPQYRTWDTWCADYTSGFLALCEQVGYMHESERIVRYIGGLKHDIAQEIQLRGITDFQEILAMAEKLDFFRRPRPGSYGSSSNWGHRSRGTNEGAMIRAVTVNAATAPFKGRCFVRNQPGHCKSECPETLRERGKLSSRNIPSSRETLGVSSRRALY